MSIPSRLRTDIRQLVSSAEKAEVTIRNLRQKLEALPVLTLDTSDFDRQLEEEHPGFHIALANAYPTLTAMERRICALLRLHLTTGDIATVFCLPERTIESYRSSIRRKLRMEKGRDMAGVLHRL